MGDKLTNQTWKDNQSYQGEDVGIGTNGRFLRGAEVRLLRGMMGKHGIRDI